MANCLNSVFLYFTRTFFFLVQLSVTSTQFIKVCGPTGVEIAKMMEARDPRL